MEFVKADDQIVLQAHYTHKGQCYLSVSIMGMFRFGDYGFLQPEKDAQKILESQVDQDLILDYGLPKAQAEFFLSGHAYSPNPKGQTESDVTVQVGAIKKRLLVFGDREWSKGLVQYHISPPLSFTKMPLTEEYAFGGEGTPNDKGRGVWLLEGADPEKPVQLPNLELPNHLIVYRKDLPSAATFLPLSQMHPARLPYLGTFDAEWVKSGWPHFPDDFKLLYFNRAPHNQWQEGFFKGDEPIMMEHLNLDQPKIECSLPGIRFKAFIHTQDKKFQEVPVNLDTLWLFPDLGLGFVVGHMQTPVNSELNEEIAHVYTITETLITPIKPIEAYQDDFKAKQDKAMKIDEAEAPELEDDEDSEDKDQSLQFGSLTAGQGAAAKTSADLGSLAAQAAMVTGGVLGVGAAALAAEEEEPPEESELTPEEEKKIKADIRAFKRSQAAEDAQEEADQRAQADAEIEQYKANLRKAGVDVDTPKAPSKPADIPPQLKQALSSGDPQAISQAMQAQGVSAGAGTTTSPEAASQAGGLTQANAASATSSQVLAAADAVSVLGGFGSIMAQGLDPADPKIADNLKQYQSAAAESKGDLNEDLQAPEEATAEQEAEKKAEQEQSPKKPDTQSPSDAASDQDADKKSATAGEESKAGADESEEEARNRDAEHDDGEPKYKTWLDRLIHGDVEGLDLTGVKLWRLMLPPKLNLTGIILKHAELQYATLVGVIFKEANLESANFEGANLSGAVFENANLAKANFKNANLSGAIFKGSDCEGACFIQAQLEDVHIENANFNKAQFKNLTLSGIAQNSHFNETLWESVDFTALKAQGSFWDQSHFKTIKASGVDLNHCELSKSRFEDMDFHKSQLVNSVWIGSTFENVNFSNAELSGASFLKAKIKKCDFAQAGMQNIRMSYAYFDEVHFEKSELTNSALDNTKFNRCHFNGATMTQAGCSKSNFETSSLKGVNARHIIFTEASLAGVDCSSSDFLQGNFSFANCENANFNDCNLYDATFYRVIMDNASFLRITAQDHFIEKTFLSRRKKIVVPESV